MGPDFDYLLAKSYPDCAAGAAPPAYARLLPHLMFVEDAGRAIVDAVGKKVLRQLDLHTTVGRLQIIFKRLTASLLFNGSRPQLAPVLNTFRFQPQTLTPTYQINFTETICGEAMSLSNVGKPLDRQ
jgi:hypothetical protein